MRQAVAREIMSSPVVTVSPDTPFREIVAIMLQHKISGLPVVDETGLLRGIVTEADLLLKEEVPQAQPALIPWHGASLRLERIVDRHRKAEGKTAGELMTENVVTAEEDTSVHRLAHLMLARNVNRIPIVRNGLVVGIVTRADILKLFTRSTQTLLAAVREVLAHDLWIDPTKLAITCQDGLITIAGEVDRRSDRDLVVRWIKTIDGVVGVDADRLEFRIDDQALGKVVR
ncbi:MAG TPA: CBS domain-containing protein [bacterium]|nr:CBS domain-containing protein [bacterium]